MTLFTDPKPVLFDEQLEPEVAGAVPPETARRTARLAAFAETDLSEQAGPILETMQARIDMYESQIAAQGDTAVRMAAAERGKERRMQNLETVLTESLPGTDPELTRGSAIAYQNLAALDAAEDAQYALEQQAVENIQNLAARGDITQARVMLSNLENGNALDVIRDMTAKQMILQNMIERAAVTQQDQPWFRDLADFVLAAVPLYSPSRTGNVDVADGVKNWYDSLFSGERYRNEADSLWDMPIAEFSKFVNEDFVKNLHENSTLFGYTNNSEMLDILTGLGDRTPSATETNLWAAADIAGVVPWGTVTKVGRGGLGLAGSMVRNGARREAAEYTAAHAMNVMQDSAAGAARATGLSEREVENALSVAAVAPEASDVRVSIAMATDSALERVKAIFGTNLELEAQARLTAEELTKARDVVAQRMERRFGRTVQDVDVVSERLTAGSQVNRIQFTLGDESGNAFASEKLTNEYISSIGGLGGQAIQDSSGQWFARMELDLPETGFFSNLLNVRTPSPARFVLSSRSVGDIELADAAQTAGNARNRLLKTLVEPYSDTFRSLRGSERHDLAQVLQAGESLGSWFSKDQIETLYARRFNRAPSERELAGYQAARDINDIEFSLRNDDVYQQLRVKGFQTTSFDTGLGVVDRANALVDFELKDIPRQRMYDVSRREHVNMSGSSITPKMWERMKGQGYTVVTLERAMALGDGSTVKTFLVRGKDATFENLKRDQIAYRAGGHRMYRGKYFVKQTVRGRQPDTGAEFLDNPNTYIAAETRAEAAFWSKRMEAARVAMNEGADLARLDEILGGHAGLPSAEDFVRTMNDPQGAFQKDTKFDVYYDREMPEEYLSDGQGLEFVDAEETGFNGFLRTQGRMYTGRKGEQLPDYMGNMAPLLDPYETINKSLMNIASLSSFGDYKIQAVERWMKTFGGELDKTDIPDDWSSMRLFMEAPLRKGGNLTQQRIRNAALAQREIINRTLGWKTETDLAGEQFTRRMSDWIAGDNVGGALPEARKALVNWWEDTNPVSALRSFAFDLKLGLGNIAQLPMQIQTAVAATALDPVNGMRGWAMIAPMRFMLGGRTLTKEAFEARLEHLVQNGVDKLGGFENAKDFKEFTRAALRSGFFDLGGTHSLLDSYGPNAALNGFASGTERVREAGRFFFYEAERWNRIVAWRISWAEAKKAGLKPGTPEFAKTLAGRAEDYSFRMSRESQAWWQQGLLSIPTQFWAYNARMIEAMLPKRLGGATFTRDQKIRLMLAQTFLYGSAGLPLTGLISEVMKGQAGDVPPITSVLGMIDRGFLDTAVHTFTGADVLVGKRYGTGGWATDVVRNLFSFSQYGEVSAAEILGGATAGIMGKVVTDTLRYVAAESGDQSQPLTDSALRRLFSNVSTVNNFLKAEMAFNYGIYKSGSGRTDVTGLPSATAFAIAMGIAPAELDFVGARMAHNKKESEAVKDAARIFANYRTDMVNRPDQIDSIMEEVNAFSQLLPEDIRRKALAQVPERIDPSLYDSLVRRMEREEQQEEAANGQTN